MLQCPSEAQQTRKFPVFYGTKRFIFVYPSLCLVGCVKRNESQRDGLGEVDRFSGLLVAWRDPIRLFMWGHIENIVYTKEVRSIRFKRVKWGSDREHYPDICSVCEQKLKTGWISAAQRTARTSKWKAARSCRWIFVWCISYLGWSDARNCFIIIAFKHCFKQSHRKLWKGKKSPELIGTQ